MSGDSGKRPASEAGTTEGGARQLRGPWWFRGNRELTEDQRGNLFAQVFFEGNDRRVFLGRFSVLMALSILLATLGVAEDSPPVVIGAMLISPLTTPLMGLCTSLILGWPRRQLQSLLVLAGATLGGIALGFLVMLVIPEPQQVTVTSTELLERTEPGVFDLAVAIVAGAAGAYVLVRREAIGALPGVAIAVALVPPLAATGMLLELGELDLAREAGFLYVTNLAGIILSGTVVMLILGVQPHREGDRLPRETRLGIGVAIVAALVLIYPLTAETRGRLIDAVDHDDAHDLAVRWLEGTGLEVRHIEAGRDTVDIEVAGPNPPPPIGPLAEGLADEFEEEVDVSVRWIEEEVIRARGKPGEESGLFP
ncbi:MAG: DUF389 domain-containing protein [Solirubrobacterales bacterium]